MCSPSVPDCRCFIFVSVSRLLFIPLGTILDPLFLITSHDILIPWKYCTSPYVAYTPVFIHRVGDLFVLKKQFYMAPVENAWLSQTSRLPPPLPHHTPLAPVPSLSWRREPWACWLHLVSTRPCTTLGDSSEHRCRCHLPAFPAADGPRNPPESPRPSFPLS